MAAIEKRSSGPSLSSLLPPSNEVISGLRAGEDIGAGDLCEVGGDGLVMLHTDGVPRGISSDVGASTGEAVTLYRNVRIGYGSGLTPGTTVYPSGSVPGGLDDDAGGGEDDPGAAAIGWVVDDERIQLTGL